MEKDKSLPIKEIRATYTVKLYPYLQDKLNEFTHNLNTILFEHFEYNAINNCLFAEYRDRIGGFNHSLALEFIMKIFDLLNNETDLRDFMIPEIKNFLIEKNKIKIIVDKEKNAKKEDKSSQ